MILISVDQPFSVCDKSPRCYFKRELVQNDSLTVDLEKVIQVLHVLFAGVPHEINIKYIY